MEQEDKKQDVLAIWQTCVEMANGVSQRRDTMNNLFVTLNIAVIAAVSWMWDVKTVFLCVAGLVICVVWLLYMNKKIIAVEPWGASHTSAVVKNAANETVGWSTSSIVRAIRGY